MPVAEKPLNVVIGERVRHLRGERGWTLDRLSELAGVSRRMLVSVEKGEVNPSIGTLLRLSEALGIGLPSLVEPQRRERARVTPSGEGALLWEGKSGGRGLLVAGTGGPDVVELWQWTLAPREVHASEAHSPGTMELLQVLEGSLSVEVGGESFVLSTGDALKFPGDETHSYSNPNDTWAKFALTVFEPRVVAPNRVEIRNG